MSKVHFSKIVLNKKYKVLQNVNQRKSNERTQDSDQDERVTSFGKQLKE